MGRASASEPIISPPLELTPCIGRVGEGTAVRACTVNSRLRAFTCVRSESHA